MRRVVRHTDLDQRCPLPAELGLDLRIDQRAGGGQAQAANLLAPEDLERAVEIAQVHPEEDTNGEVEDLGVDPAV